MTNYIRTQKNLKIHFYIYVLEHVGSPFDLIYTLKPDKS